MAEFDLGGYKERQPAPGVNTTNFVGIRTMFPDGVVPDFMDKVLRPESEFRSDRSRGIGAQGQVLRSMFGNNAARAALRKRAEEDRLFRKSIEFGDMEYATRLPLEEDYIKQLGLRATEQRADEVGNIGLSEYIRHIMKNKETGEISGDVPGDSIYGTQYRGRYYPIDNNRGPVTPGSMYINTTDIMDKYGSPEGEHAKDQALLERHLTGNPIVAHELGHVGMESLWSARPELVAEGRELGLSEEDVLGPLDAQNYIGKNFPERLLSEEERRKVARLNTEDRSLSPSNIRMARAIESGRTSETKGIGGYLASLSRKATEKVKAGEKLSYRERAVVKYINSLQEAARKEIRKRRGVH